MVLASKRAVGSEYEFVNPAYQPRERQNIKKRTRRRTSPVIGSAVGVFFILSLFIAGLSFTYIKAVKAQLNWQLNQFYNSNQSLKMNNEKLKLEIAKLESPDRIEYIAITEMGLVKHQQVQYVAQVKTDFQDASAGLMVPTVEEKQGHGKTRDPGNPTEITILEKIAAAIFSRG